MLTLKQISEDTEKVIKGLEKKHFEGAREAIEKVLEFDKIRREAQQKLDSNKAEQNKLSKQIGGLMKQGKRDEDEKIKDQDEKIKERDKTLSEKNNQLRQLVLALRDKGQSLEDISKLVNLDVDALTDLLESC